MYVPFAPVLYPQGKETQKGSKVHAAVLLLTFITYYDDDAFRRYHTTM